MLCLSALSEKYKKLHPEYIDLLDKLDRPQVFLWAQPDSANPQIDEPAANSIHPIVL